MTARVELIYDGDCPNIEGARQVLLDAFGQLGLSPTWSEWNHSSEESPAYVRDHGSPTILVDGQDVAGAASGDGGASCRVYRTERGEFSGTPPLRAVQAALVGAFHASPRSRSGWLSFLGVAPGVGLSVLPIGACPACWPAYAGLLSSLGLGFLFESVYALPLTAAFLALALSALGYRARSRRGHGPLALGAFAAALLLLGKFPLASNAVLYAGLALLVGASIWNAWPRKTDSTGPCPKCVGQSLVGQSAKKGETA